MGMAVLTALLPKGAEMAVSGSVAELSTISARPATVWFTVSWEVHLTVLTPSLTSSWIQPGLYMARQSMAAIQAAIRLAAEPSSNSATPARKR